RDLSVGPVAGVRDPHLQHRGGPVSQRHISHKCLSSLVVHLAEGQVPVSDDVLHQPAEAVKPSARSDCDRLVAHQRGNVDHDPTPDDQVRGPSVPGRTSCQPPGRPDPGAAAAAQGTRTPAPQLSNGGNGPPPGVLPWHTYIQADQIGPEIWIRKSIGDAPGPHWTGE